MSKVNPALQSTVAGSSDAGLHNLSLIKSTTPGQTNAKGGIRSPNISLIGPDRRIDPATTSRATTPQQRELDRTAAAVMARADPITEQVNASVKSFYQDASGGLAARANRNMAGSLRGIAELKSQLAHLIKSSASFVATNSAEFPALGKWHQGLIKSLAAIDSWSKSANAYAAGLTGPGGKHTATPTLVQPPSVILSSSVSLRSATQEAAAIWQQYQRANAVIART